MLDAFLKPKVSRGPNGNLCTVIRDMGTLAPIDLNLIMPLELRAIGWNRSIKTGESMRMIIDVINAFMILNNMKKGSYEEAINRLDDKVTFLIK